VRIPCGDDWRPSRPSQPPSRSPLLRGRLHFLHFLFNPKAQLSAPIMPCRGMQSRLPDSVITLFFISSPITRARINSNFGAPPRTFGDSNWVAHLGLLPLWFFRFSPSLTSEIAVKPARKPGRDRFHCFSQSSAKSRYSGRYSCNIRALSRVVGSLNCLPAKHSSALESGFGICRRQTFGNASPSEYETLLCFSLQPRLAFQGQAQFVSFRVDRNNVRNSLLFLLPSFTSALVFHMSVTTPGNAPRPDRGSPAQSRA